MVEGKTTRQYLSSRTKKSRVQNFAKFWANVQNLRNNIPVKCNTIKEHHYYFFLILKESKRCVKKRFYLCRKRFYLSIYQLR